MNTRLLADKGRLLAASLPVAIFLLGMGLRLYALDARSLWGDEFFTANLVRLDLGSIVAGTAADVHPPLSYVVTRFFIILLGDSHLVLRLPAALFGSLSILLAYKAGEMLWTREVGVTGAFLLSVAPYHVHYSQFARHYTLTAFLALLSLIFLLKALETTKKVWWIGFAVCASFSIYNIYFAFLPLASQVIFGAWVIAENWLSHSREGTRASGAHASAGLSRAAKQALMLVSSLIFVGLLFLPWLPTMVRQVFGEYIEWKGFGGDMMPGVSLSLDYFHVWLKRYSGVSGIPLLLFFGLFVLGLVSCRGGRILLVASWLGMPFVFAFLVSSHHFFYPRYGLFVLPMYLLVVGKGIWSLAALLQRLLDGLRSRRTWTMLLVPSLVVVLGLLSAPRLGRYYVRRKAEWRAAAVHLRDGVQEGDIILVDGKGYRSGPDALAVEYCLSYYLSSYGMGQTPVVRVERGIWEAIEGFDHSGHEVWAVIWYPGRPSSWTTVQEITIIDFGDASIIRLRQPSGDMLQDTVSVLQVLSELLSGREEQFDVHLALAEMYLRTERFEEARMELEMASQVEPGMPPASQDLGEVCAELEQFSDSEEMQIQHAVWRSLAQAIAFVGYHMDPTSVRAGGTVDIALWWQALAEVDRDYSVFIHMVGQDDRIWAQTDRLLRQGGRRGCPTSSWIAGKTVREEYQLELPPDIPAGEYTVKTGVYFWGTGERLSVRDENGQRAAEDAILLRTIIVNE